MSYLFGDFGLNLLYQIGIFSAIQVFILTCNWLVCGLNK